jgi:hypothetical protein
MKVKEIELSFLGLGKKVRKNELFSAVKRKDREK